MSEHDIIALLRFARVYCSEKLPWFAPALYACKIVLTKKVAVAAIDNKFNVYFNPDAVSNMNEQLKLEDLLAELGFLWIHEISHVLREHMERAADWKAEPYLWNIAADLEINDSDWEGLRPPSLYVGVFPKTFSQPEGQLAEYYYKALVNTKNVPPDLVQDEGSGVHGQARPWEQHGNSGQKGEDIDENGQGIAINEGDPMELDRIRREVAQEILDAKRNAGNIPGGWARWADKKMTPIVNWRKLLKHRLSIARSKGMGHKIDYGYTMPGRRQSITFPLLPPRLLGSMDGNIAVVIDTSGSMSSAYISQCIAEVFTILNTFGSKVYIIPCDYNAYNTITVQKPSELFEIKKLPGGGGTNMCNGIDAALQLKPLPDAVLVLTDGYTDYPSKPHAKVPIMFGIIKSAASDVTPLPNMPPWHATSVVPIVLTNE